MTLPTVSSSDSLPCCSSSTTAIAVNCFDTETILLELRPKYYVKGKDWEGRLPAEQVRICAEQGIGIVYLDTVLDSSTRILQQFASQQQNQR